MLDVLNLLRQRETLNSFMVTVASSSSSSSLLLLFEDPPPPPEETTVAEELYVNSVPGVAAVQVTSTLSSVQETVDEAVIAASIPSTIV
jgi:hypothetical protein